MQAPGAGSGIGIGNGSVWMINPAGQVYNWSGTAWVNQVAYTAADGSMWFLGSTMPSAPGYRYVYHFSAGQLVQAPGAGSGIGIGNGSVWMINPAGQVYNWSGTAWVNQVAYTAADGSMWFLGSTMPSAPGYRYVYHFSAGQLVQAPGAGSGIGIGNGSVWMINPAGQVYNWSGTAWVNQVAYTAADGSMWFLGSTMPSAPGYRYVYYFNARPTRCRRRCRLRHRHRQWLCVDDQPCGSGLQLERHRLG